MRYLPKTLVFAAVTAAQIVPGCDAVADGLSLHPGLKFELAQASPAAVREPLAELLARATALSSSGKFLEAYQLLLAAEDTYIGEIEFDYALGRAALDAGRPDKATLAFSRVLALDPNHAGALIDTGRAYLALGNFAQARVTFERLLALDPPPAVRAQLQAYLQQAQLQRAYGLTMGNRSARAGGLSQSGYVAAIVGRSTNVNQSPAQSQVFVPALNTSLVLSDQNVRKPDNFSGILGGVDLSLPINGTYSLIGGGDFIERTNRNESAFDIGGIGARLGIAAASDGQLLRVQVRAARDYLGDTPSYDLNALTLDYLRSLDAGTQALAFTQAGRLRYVPEDLKIFDADFVTFGLGAIRRIAEDSTAFVVISTGELKDIGGNVSGDKRSLGLRVGADVAIAPRLRLLGSAAWERGQFNQVDPSFLVERRDVFTNYEAVLAYALNDRASLRFGVTLTNQRSNIVIYEYDRTEGWMMLRFDFP
jgi:tetratricopeptide (TPR) repeat protein